MENLKVYANTLIDKVIYIRDHAELTEDDRETLADICNLVENNMDVLKRE